MTLDGTIYFMLVLVFLKSVFIGSEFSFYNWFKHGLLYIHWYNNRQTFKQWLETDAKKLIPIEE